MFFECTAFQRRIFQYLAAVGANLGMISIGMHYGWLSTSIPVLTSGNYTFQLTNDQGSWLASTVPIGAGFGDVIAAFTTNILGRKKLITFASIPLALAWLLIAVAPSAVYMFLGKFLAGIFDGIMFTAVPSYLAEISEPEIRGLLGSTYSVTVVLGMLLMNTFLYFMSMEVSAYIAAAVSLPMMLIMPFLPDSAYFYCLRKKPEEAKESLQKYLGKGDVQAELARISEGVEKEIQHGGRFIELFTKPVNRKALIISTTLCLLNQLTGINAIMAYCTTVFENSKNFLSPDTSNFIFFVVYFLISIISLFLVDISGRKLLLIISALGASTTLFGTATYLFIQNKTSTDVTNYEYIQLVFLILYIILYSLGLQTIPTLMSAELFSSNIKGLGLCITNITFSVAITLSLKLFSWATDTYGMHVPIYYFAIMAIVLILFVVYFLPETKGKTLEDVQRKLQKGKKGKKWTGEKDKSSGNDF